MRCPLCKSSSPATLLDLNGRRYLHCHECDLRFLDNQCYLERQDEVCHYHTHNNDLLDVRYQKYVEPLFEDIRWRLVSGNKGLDYGCGEAPVVTYLLEKLGFEICLYDPVFHPDKSTLNKIFDFIIVSETAEHFHFPDHEFSQLNRLLHANGLLCIMTKFYEKGTDFEKWHYRRDPTHVCFYSRETFKWIAESYGFNPPEFSSDRVVILTKKEVTRKVGLP